MAEREATIANYESCSPLRNRLHLSLSAGGSGVAVKINRNLSSKCPAIPMSIASFMLELFGSQHDSVWQVQFFSMG
jgi:hypothetical protein